MVETGSGQAWAEHDLLTRLSENTACWKASEAVRDFALLFSPGTTLGCAWAWNGEIFNFLPRSSLRLLVYSSFDMPDAKTCFFFLPFLFIFFGLEINFPSLVNANANNSILKPPTTPENKDRESSVYLSPIYVHRIVWFRTTISANSHGQNLVEFTCSPRVCVAFLQVCPAEQERPTALNQALWRL